MLGYQSAIGFAQETVFGTAVAPTSWIKYSSESFNKTITEKLDDTINGSREYDVRVTMEESADGNVSFPMRPAMGEAMLFKHLSGGNFVKTSVAASVFRYDFKIGAVTSATSLCFTKVLNSALSTSVFYFTGQRANSASFEVSVGNLLMCNLDFMGVNASLANTLPTASYATSNPYTFKEAILKVGSTSADATSTVVDSVSLNIGTNLIEDRAIGSAFRNELADGSLDVTGSFNAKYSDNGLINRFLNKTKSYLEVVYDSGVTIASTYTHKITFKCFNAYLNGNIPQVGGRDEIIKHELPFRAIKQDATYGSMFIELITSENIT